MTSPARAALLDRPLVRGLVAAAILLAVGAAVFATRALGGDDGGDDTIMIVPTPGDATQEPGLGPVDGSGVTIGEPAPDFILRDLEGETVQLSDLRGEVVWINFWATWCGPCKKELPVIQTIYDEKKAEGLAVLALNLEESADKARDFFDENGWTMPVLLDSAGTVYDQYRLQGLPDSIFVDRNGVVTGFQYGEITESKARERLAAAGLP